MAHRIVILGGGTGGTLAANRLARLLGDGAEITVVDVDDLHVYQPGLLFVPFGLLEPEEIVKSRRAQLNPRVKFICREASAVDIEANTVQAGDETIEYDVLVVATGAVLRPEETEGLGADHWGPKVFTFYSLDGVAGLHEALRTLDSGRLVVNPVAFPIKCPLAPLEFCFHADWYFRQRRVRDKIEIVYAAPRDEAFASQLASKRLTDLIAEKGIVVETDFATARVDGRSQKLASWDGRELQFDVLVTIPAHGGAPYVARSPGLGDALGFVPADPHTLQSRAAANIFVIGDASDLPTPKEGSVAHYEADTLVENVRRFLGHEALIESFDGHTSCFVETGFHKALLLDFNYELEPFPGRYPAPHAGPLRLLRESRLNHLARLMLQAMYWHVLLPGHVVPGVSSQLHHT